MSRQPMQLVLIEDNSGDARLIHEMLTDGLAGRLELKQADRLSTGLALIALGGIQLGLLDLSLPDASATIREYLGLQPLFSTKAKGIGLGLAVSKKLIEANGGKIEAQSEPGRGSTFTVLLPVAGQNND
jgi:hypothetical protein